MENIEKAKEMICKHIECKHLYNNKCDTNYCFEFKVAMDLLEWKENQQKEFSNCANCKHSSIGCESPTEYCFDCKKHKCFCDIDEEHHNWWDNCKKWKKNDKNE